MTKEERRVYSRNYYVTHKEHILARQREIALKFPERIRGYRNQEHAQIYQKAYALAHLAERRAYSRQYHQENPSKRQSYREANLQRIHTYNKEYAQAHAEEIKSRRIRNRERNLQIHREYNASNRAKLHEWNHAHRENRRILNSARRAKMPSSAFSLHDWQAVVEWWHSRCVYCGLTGRLTMDHIVPLARGGSHVIGNVVPACKTCNCRKGTKLWIPLRLV